MINDSYIRGIVSSFVCKMYPGDETITSLMDSTFTGCKNADLLILSFLDYESLFCMYRVNKYGKSLCFSSDLWKIKIRRLLSKHIQPKLLDQYLEFVYTKCVGVNFTWNLRWLEYETCAPRRVSVPRQISHQIYTYSDDEISAMYNLRMLPKAVAYTDSSVITWCNIEPLNPPNISD